MNQAYLTFIRRKNDDFSFLAIENPNNLKELKKSFLRSGQPAIVIKDNNKLLALYAIGNDGELFQIYGTEDYLFLMKNIYDASMINIKKYNFIRYMLTEAFDELSIQESKQYKTIFENYEDLIFYTTLHAELDISNIKNIIIKELRKIDISYSLKIRLVKKLKLVKQVSENYLRKKIDIDLTGYGIYIKFTTIFRSSPYSSSISYAW
jgi:hypothetical protein